MSGGDRHEFEMVMYAPGPYEQATAEAAKSLIGQTVPVRDGLDAGGGVSVDASVPYEVIDAWLDDEGRVVARLRALWSDDDPRTLALQRVRRFMSSGEFQRRFDLSFDENLSSVIKRDDKLIGEMADPSPEPLQVEGDETPPDLLAGS